MDYKNKINNFIKNTFSLKQQQDCVSNIQQPLINIKKKILLIDDDQILNDMYSMKFNKNGYEIKTAASGEEAIMLIKEGYIPDILITDLMMPIMDGFTVFETIKKENLAPNVIAIMLTNKGLSEEINKAKDLGFHGYIVKATTIQVEVVEEVKKIYKENCK